MKNSLKGFRLATARRSTTANVDLCAVVLAFFEKNAAVRHNNKQNTTAQKRQRTD